jgi:hypothetical protein
MKRDDYDRIRRYRPAECCSNCGNLFTEAKDGEEFAKDGFAVLLKCKEMMAKRIDVLLISGGSVCNAWRPE